MNEGPVLVSIQTDPNALAMPPRLEFDRMKGFALYMGQMMLSGRMDEVDKIKLLIPLEQVSPLQKVYSCHQGSKTQRFHES